MYLTWLDSNSWLIELGGQRILLDPWLVGPLVFGGQEWFFKIERNQPRPIPEAIDLILISQGLADHAHTETLKVLDRSIPVIASPSAAKLVTELGYQSVTALAPDQSYTIGNLDIHALAGAPIGPFVLENAYVLKDRTTGQNLYYEPHGYPSPALANFAPVNVAITPVVDIRVPLLGSILQGYSTAVEIAKTLQAQVLLPTAAGGDAQFGGVLNALLRSQGSPDEVRAKLVQQGVSTQLIDPKPGDRFHIPL